MRSLKKIISKQLFPFIQIFIIQNEHSKTKIKPLYLNVFKNIYIATLPSSFWRIQITALLSCQERDTGADFYTLHSVFIRIYASKTLIQKASFCRHTTRYKADTCHHRVGYIMWVTLWLLEPRKGKFWAKSLQLLLLSAPNLQVTTRDLRRVNIQLKLCYRF